MQVHLGDPSYVRVRVTDFGLTSPRAMDWMMDKLHGPGAFGDITDITLLEDSIVFELSGSITTQDDAKEITRQAMQYLATAFDGLTYDEYTKLHGVDFNPMAVSSGASTGLTRSNYAGDYSDG